MVRVLFGLSLGVVAIGLTACSRPLESEVRLLSTMDQETTGPMLGAFVRAQDQPIQPAATFLAIGKDPAAWLADPVSETLLQSADVLWTEDLLLLVKLEQQGRLAARDWKLPADFPDGMQGEQGTWCGAASIARVLLVHREQLQEDAPPQSVDELADPRWKDRCAMAAPLRGVAAVHAGVIAHQKGQEAALRWFKQVASNAEILPTDAAVANAVAAGRVTWGLTSSNYAVVQRDENRQVDIVFPDQGSSQQGTVRLPHAVAVLSSASHPVAAAHLAQFLVSPDTEDRLAMSDAAFIPLSRAATHRPRVLPSTAVRWAMLDFASSVTAWEGIREQLNTLFAAPTDPQVQPPVVSGNRAP